MFRYVIVVVLLWVPLPSLAQPAQSPVDEAREHFLRGQLAFNQQRWLACAEAFEASFEAIFAPELLYNVALCYERAADEIGESLSLSYRERALAAYTRYLRELPNASDFNDVQARVQELRSLVARLRELSSAEVEVPEPQEEESLLLREAPSPPSIPPFSPVAVPVTRDTGFTYEWTVITGSATLLSFLVAVGLSLVAQAQFDSLVSSCGQTPQGCSPAQVEGVSSLVTGANALYASSGVLLGVTAVSFALEFDEEN